MPGGRTRPGAALAELAHSALLRRHIYAVWQSHDSFTVLGNPVDDTIMLSRSTDGGQHWSNPVKVNHTPSAYNEQAFTASVHVGEHGDVAVTYYDMREDAQGATQHGLLGGALP